MKSSNKEVEEIEIGLLLEGIYRQYGYDFRDYAPASLKRRILKAMADEKLNTVSALQDRVLHDPACMKRFLLTVSIDVTSMFRDPGFYLAIRKKVIPLLRNQPFIRIWDAGCSSGEQAYSLAILLEEEGLYGKIKVYATDLNDELLERGKAGIYPLKKMKEYTENYKKAGGSMPFSNYYTARYENARFKSSLKKNIVWAPHNLVTDASFNEFHLILCRNVMIYFNRSLQNRVHKLLYESLAISGVLGLGSKESLNLTPYDDYYEELDGREKLYRKIK
ncbi:MAG: protein-glutamate O-methyltransferase CheR [Syntrophales bacterium]|nr:protein-glutamate O-methyltransferase CheR [Syntrophales bacterium]